MDKKIVFVLYLVQVREERDLTFLPLKPRRHRGGVGVVALGQNPAVLEQVKHLRPRHEREYCEEDGEVQLLGRDRSSSVRK